MGARIRRKEECTLSDCRVAPQLIIAINVRPRTGSEDEFICCGSSPSSSRDVTTINVS